MARTTNVPMYGTWTIVVTGRPPVAAVSPTEQGVLVFARGAALSILLFFLVLVLARSRERALELVEEKNLPAPPPGAPRLAHGPPEPGSRPRPS